MSGFGWIADAVRAATDSHFDPFQALLARQALAECKRLQPHVSIDWVEKYYAMIRVEDRARYIEGLRRAGLE